MVSEKSRGIGIGSSGPKEKLLYRIDIKIFSLAIYRSICNWQNRHKDKKIDHHHLHKSESLNLDSENLIIIRME